MLRIRDVYPGYRILIFTHPGSRISDPGSKNSNERQVKKIPVPFYWSHKCHKIELFYFWNVEEKNLGQFSKNYRTFYPKNCHQALKNMGLGSGNRDPGSGKNLFRIPDPGVKKAPDPGSGSATLEISCVEVLDVLFWWLKASPIAWASFMEASTRNN